MIASFAREQPVERSLADTELLRHLAPLLAEARTGLHEQDATIREFEQQALEKSLAAKSLDVSVVDAIVALIAPREGERPPYPGRRRRPIDAATSSRTKAINLLRSGR